MNIKRYGLSLILFSIIFLGTPWSDILQSSEIKEKEKRIDKCIQTIVEAYQIPGLAIAIVENNQIVFTKAA